MRFESYVAFRYLRGKRKSRFVSLISLISVAGVSIGVIALIVVMSVMTGFDIALRDTIIGNRSHLTVEERSSTIANPDELI
ncbi:MAG: lipoprotein-releasing system transmembrane subunit LolC, partial [Candidatus Hydrogenedentes bacterium]|nr:lipoprotein-releasing system transmembrane subunit LolC [Candidatus Hydrogenedentota bacterium]